MSSRGKSSGPAGDQYRGKWVIGPPVYRALRVAGIEATFGGVLLAVAGAPAWVVAGFVLFWLTFWMLPYIIAILRLRFDR